MSLDNKKDKDDFDSYTVDSSFVRGKAGPMDIDSFEEWITTSQTITNLNSVNSVSASSPFKIARVLSSTSVSQHSTPVVCQSCSSPLICDNSQKKESFIGHTPNNPGLASFNHHSSPWSSTMRRKYQFPPMSSPLVSHNMRLKSSSPRLKKTPVRSPSQPQSSNLTKHLYWPFILMGYLQLAFNVSIVLFLSYLALSFYLTIRQDIQVKVVERHALMLSEIAQCRRHFLDNRCDEYRVPAMEAQCSAWHQCMQRDPNKLISRARLVAETVAEIVNGLIEPVSYKTLLFLVIGTVAMITVSNYAFALARARVLLHSMNIDTNVQRNKNSNKNTTFNVSSSAFDDHSPFIQVLDDGSTVSFEGNTGKPKTMTRLITAK